METHDLRETVEASLRLTTYLIREARIHLVKEIPEQVMLVTYDPQQIEQVLINMIHNAIQAMPNRGTLQVSLTQVDATAAIAIQDTGIGISPENLTRIFDPFFTTKPEGVGTGLGLSVSYGIIANHHGKIDVESEVGSGTKFIIYLPVERMIT
jgi:two-component system NtrC family sensor kinase